MTQTEAAQADSKKRKRANDITDNIQEILKKKRESKKEAREENEKARKEAESKKAEKKKKREEKKAEEKLNAKSGLELALEYLEEWETKKEEWKFKKARQVVLLKCMYDPYKLGKKEFKTLLKYLEGLGGNQAKTEYQRAKEIFETSNAVEEEAVRKEQALLDDEERAKAEVDPERVLRQIRIYRARKIMQLLAE
eukprot:Colp12_sorted_trinity150504_noHs@2862